MLRINLLPESARKATLSPVEQFHRTPLMWIVVGLMVLNLLGLWVPLMLHQSQLRQLTAKIRTLEPKKQAVDEIQNLVRQLQVQEGAFRRLKTGQGMWAKRLNILSDVTPEGVWFTELTLDPAKGLVIEGSAIGQGGTEMVSVGRLVQDLKESPDFSQSIKDVQIESIKRVQEHEVELVQFTISCTLEEPKL